MSVMKAYAEAPQASITSFAIGVVNFRTEIYGPSIQNLEGVMYNCVRDMSFLFFYPSINVITSELPVFMRESKARIYSPEAYYIAKSLAEVPQYIALPMIYSTILYWMTGYAAGCVFGDEGLAITIMSGFMQAMLVFWWFLHQFPQHPSMDATIFGALVLQVQFRSVTDKSME
ncbi:ABC-2 type transporter [Parelaphostrongylus tenuis]|uniref:ABC-2 type transporter n=1 Tax=Parelaphostrongylus tenuis TaxID=148309 RepID=A0AAD5QFF4_PARTN|nr:ABC-2 type transporter [Parelaphostrongylus tenuis]